MEKERGIMHIFRLTPVHPIPSVDASGGSLVRRRQAERQARRQQPTDELDSLSGGGGSKTLHIWNCQMSVCKMPTPARLPKVPV